MNEPVDFVVLQTDRTAVYGRGDVEDMMDVLEVDRLRLDLSMAGRVQVWYVPDAEGANPLSEQILTRLGYRDPTGWTGPIALTTRTEPFDTAAPFADDVRELVNEVVTTAGGVVTYATASETSPTVRSHTSIVVSARDRSADAADAIDPQPGIAEAVNAALGAGGPDFEAPDHTEADIAPPGSTHDTAIGPDFA
ncbi:hypothetical protein [Nocardia ignorata]|uniref:Uncharacterized protein n=1 Tax=Nocardia ignorata TaxID=145285 RepID=A0A4R6P6H2_NOCIG|nr:hypothetical protein [Nocardia ignorata]TDP31589.1 hypothetical protein DFR75_108194 [Nocardia ignorata]